MITYWTPERIAALAAQNAEYRQKKYPQLGEALSLLKEFSSLWDEIEGITK